MSEKNDKNELIEIGKRLEIALNKANISKKALAEELGFSSAAITHYVKGRRCLSYDDALRVAKITHTNVNNFLTQKQIIKHLSQENESVCSENDNYISLLKEIGFEVDIVTSAKTRGKADFAENLYIISNSDDIKVLKKAQNALKALEAIEQDRPLTQQQKGEKNRLEKQIETIRQHPGQCPTLDQDQWDSLVDAIRHNVRNTVLTSAYRFETSRWLMKQLSDSVNDLTNELKRNKIDLPESKKLQSALELITRYNKLN